jgi:hypothetical protein
MTQPIKPIIDAQILELALKVTQKRPKTVVTHIIEYGFITTEELTNLYGYNHPPRAARDVREVGIPLETFRVIDSTNRSIGAYRFGDPSKISQNKLAGRTTFSKPFKQRLLDRDGSCCALCGEKYEDRYLTIDHKTPYEVAGDSASDEQNPEDFMLLCGTCQRKKSWSCEHCTNWTTSQDLDICKTCYWSSPEDYSHLAQKQIKRLDLTWSGDEVGIYNKLKDEAVSKGISINDLVKQKLK